jgi:hypothetical protein
MREPSLSCGVAVADEAYRFTWLRTFHHPVAIRVSRFGGGSTLSTVVLSGAGGYEPGKVLDTSHRFLSVVEFRELVNGLEKAGFWSMPTNLRADLGGMDGARWIVEGRRPAGYWVVQRWSPDEGAYRQACLAFVKAAGIVVPKDELY